MLPILQIGPLAIQTPGLILLVGFWFSLSLAERNAHCQQIRAETLYNLAFIALIAGLLGARLAYAARYPSAFAASPISLISLNPGLFDPLGGFVIALLAMIIYGQRKGLQFYPALDALTPVFAGMLVATSLANLASGNGFGAETTVPWAIELWGATRHPTQIYETVFAIGIFTLLWPGWGLVARRFTTSGSHFFIFLTLFSSARLFLEAFRGDSMTLPNGWRIAQILAWVVLAVGLWGVGREMEIRD